MLRKIIINEKNGKITELFDNDNEKNLSDFTHELSTLLELNNISILNTSSGNLICRPQDIQSIFIEEQENNSTDSIPKLKGSLEVEDSISDL